MPCYSKDDHLHDRDNDIHPGADEATTSLPIRRGVWKDHDRTISRVWSSSPVAFAEWKSILLQTRDKEVKRRMRKLYKDGRSSLIHNERICPSIASCLNLMSLPCWAIVLVLFISHSVPIPISTLKMRFPSITVATTLACATVALCVDVNGLPGFRALRSDSRDRYAEDNDAYAAAYDEYHHAMVEREAYRPGPGILPRWFRHRPEMLPREEYQELAERDARNHHPMILPRHEEKESSFDADHETSSYAPLSHDHDFVKRALHALPILGHALAEQHTKPIETKINEAKTLTPEEKNLVLRHAVVEDHALPTVAAPTIQPKVVVAKPSKTKEPEVPAGHALADSRPLPIRSVEDNYHGAGHVHHPHHRPPFGVYARSAEEHDYDYDHTPYSYDEEDYDNKAHFYYPNEEDLDFHTDMPSAHEYEMASVLQSEQDQQFSSHHGSAAPGAHVTVSPSSSIPTPSPAIKSSPSTPISTAATAPTPAPTSTSSVSKALPVAKATRGLQARAAPAASAVVDTASRTLGGRIAQVTEFVKKMYDGIREGSVEAERKVKEGLDFVV